MAEEKGKEGTDLTHLGRSAAERRTAGEPVQDGDQEDSYGYGLRGNWGKEELAKLGITKLPTAGETMECEVRLKVTGSHQDPTDESEKSVDWVMTHAELVDGDEEDQEEENGKKAKAALFGKAEDEGGEK